MDTPHIPPASGTDAGFSKRAAATPRRRVRPAGGAPFCEVLDVILAEPHHPKPLREAPVLDGAAIETLAEQNQASTPPRHPYPTPAPTSIIQRSA